MADVKWIKICTDIFDDEKIVLLENLPEADSIIVIWFKLLCMAGKQNNSGVFMLNDRIAYTDEMLATIFRRQISTVRLALASFEKFGMIEIVDGTITIPNWEKHQSIEKMEKLKEQNKKRVAAHRERQKMKALGTPQNICAYCGKQGSTIDHVIPKSKGGTNNPDNLVECCLECNSSKQDRDLLDFLNNCVHIRYVGADIQRILCNPKLNRYVDYDFEKQMFIQSCNALRNDYVQNCNATDKIRLEEDKEKEKNNIYTAVIQHLNEKAGTNYRASSAATQRHINGRIKEGFTLEDFFTVIDKKCAEWKNNAEMQKYLRPETLFGTKFESYLNAPTAARNNKPVSKYDLKGGVNL